MLVAGFTIWKDDGRQVAELSGRNTAAYRLHVADLHDFATQIDDYLARFSTTHRVPFSDPMAPYFRLHYPDAADALGALNSGRDHQDEILEAFWTACKQNAVDVSGHVEPDVTDFLFAIGQQQSVAIDELAFDLRDGNLVVALPNAPAHVYTLAALPLPDSATNLRLLSASVGVAIRAVRQSPATRAFLSRRDLRHTKAAAHNALREALLDHDPPGECPKCPTARG